MASGGMRQCIQDITPYLLFLIFISTLGPLQFGFHLVCNIITFMLMTEISAEHIAYIHTCRLILSITSSNNS